MKKSVDDLDLSDDEGVLSIGTEMKSVQKSEYVELLASVDSLRDDVQRLMLLIPQLASQISHPAAQPQPPMQQPAADAVIVVVQDPAPPQSAQEHPQPAEHSQLARTRDNIGPPPPSPPTQHNIPPLPFASLLQAAQQEKAHDHEKKSLSQPPSPSRDHVGPPPATPVPNIRTSAHHIPTIPPPPHDHIHHHTHTHTHDRDLHHGHSLHDHSPSPQSHGLLRLPHTSSVAHLDRLVNTPSPSSSAPSSPVNSAPPSPALRSRMNSSPQLPAMHPLSEPTLLSLEQPLPASPRKRVEL